MGVLFGKYEVCYGGETGIRTLGGVTLNGFQGRRFRPLSHLSNKWCLGPDLNRHGLYARGILSPLCLPIPPPRQKLWIGIISKQNLNLAYGGGTRIRTGDQSFAGSCLSHLAMPPNHILKHYNLKWDLKMERETGLEPATLSLEG